MTSVRAANGNHQRSKSSPSNQGKPNLTSSSSRGASAAGAFFKRLVERADPLMQQGKHYWALTEKYIREDVDSEQVWVIGHVSFLLHVLLYFFGFGSASGSTFPLAGLFSLWTWEAFYRRACYSLFLSYSIVNQKQYLLARSKADFSWASLLLDANVLYWGLTTWMILIAEPFNIALYTMFIYSFYHVAHHFSGRIAAGSSLAPVLAFIQPAFKYQTQVTLLCAHLEILGVLVLVIRFFSGVTSFISLALYVQFIRFQYAASGRTRLAFKEIDTVCSKHILQNPSVPPVVKQAYTQTTMFLAKAIPEFKKRED